MTEDQRECVIRELMNACLELTHESIACEKKSDHDYRDRNCLASYYERVRADTWRQAAQRIEERAKSVGK